MITHSLQEGAIVLDPFSVRMVLALVTLTLIVISCVSSRRRSPYAEWWRVALCLFFVGNAAFLLNGTASQVWANPAGKALVVAGTFCVWAGARTLRDRRASPWMLAPAPLLSGLASALDDPGASVWSGGLVYLCLTTLGITLAAMELWFAKPVRSRITKFLSIAAGLTGIYYLLRASIFVLAGPDSEIFRAFFGYAPAALMHLMLLVSVSSTMNTLSNKQLIKRLRERANRDHLTGLLNRGAFLELASRQLKGPLSHHGAALVLADLDHFKAVNDEHGHSAGDAALRAFATACTASVRSTDLVARYGGEEFVLFLPGATQQRAEAIASEISSRLSAMQGPDGLPFPTVSYGVTSTGADTPDLAFMINVADAALYSAKAQGRNRVVGADPVEIESAPEANHSPS
ncbi:GGDEF domain-containing protein [Paenarthrobacter aurescens]|uniref:GGDEF domain-containing protein n=1 Tax=Paenarthrobacter aurescens TaxID=43663 RepID=UPI0021C13BB1|nr:GGDEF domain-containing protein [Paenarthrobacter aurescens]MCT9869723.1 GGDEF domain-containing protein [Paenarthrobacter aurescens]